MVGARRRQFALQESLRQLLDLRELLPEEEPLLEQRKEVNSFSGDGWSHMAQVCERLPGAGGNVAAAGGTEHLLELEG